MSSEVQVECDKKAYMPGEIITGRVMWFCSKAPTAILVDLSWQTSGRGTTDKGKVHSEKIPCSTEKGEASFQLQIPQECPPSYSGSLVSVLWNVNCSADISWAIDPKSSQTIVISHTESPLTIPAEYKGED